MSMTCCHCGHPVEAGAKKCPQCWELLTIESPAEVAALPPMKVNGYVRTFQQALNTEPNNIAINKSIAFCYLMLQMYDQAYDYFMKATVSNYDDADVYYYAAISALKGKKAFLHTRPEIDKCLELLNAAISVNPRGIYYYYMAYIKYDYFKRKFLITKPDYKECLLKARNFGCTQAEVNEMYSVLGVEEVNMV